MDVIKYRLKQPATWGPCAFWIGVPIAAAIVGVEHTTIGVMGIVSIPLSICYIGWRLGVWKNL